MKAKIFYLSITLFLIWALFFVHQSGGPSFFLAWHKVEVGDERTIVLESLGCCYTEPEKFQFWEMNPHEELSKKAGSVSYAMWVHGIDNVFIIGFNENGKVSYKVSGGS